MFLHARLSLFIHHKQGANFFNYFSVTQSLLTFYCSTESSIFYLFAYTVLSIILADEGESGEASACGRVLIFLSWCLIIITMPFSLFVCFKVSNFFVLIMIMPRADNVADHNFLLFFLTNAVFIKNTARDF